MSFIDYFGAVTHPRKDINVKHKLLDVIFLTITGVTAGCEGWKDLVKNKAHYVLDVTYREDDSRIRRENAAENIAVARRFALNLARLHPKKDSMKGKLKHAMWSDHFRDQIMIGHKMSKV
jgi:hypothetical protein